MISTHAPVKGATDQVAVTYPDRNISTHAPVKGATDITASRKRHLHISTHAPVKGATIPQWMMTVSGSDFNPRTREGCDGPPLDLLR